MNNRHKKLLRNIGLLTIGNFASKILTFLLLPLYTNILTTTEYGTADLIFTTVGLLYPICSLLMSEAVMRFALDNKNNKQVLSNAIYITAAGTAVFLLLSPVILLFDELRDYYLLFILYYIFDVFNLILLQFAKGINKVGKYVTSGIISTVTTVVCNIILLTIFKIGLTGYLISYIAGQLFSLVYITLSCRLWIYMVPLRKLDTRYSKRLCRFSLPMIPNSISWWISNSSDKYMLMYFTNLSIIGIYSVSYKIPSIITIMSNIFMGAWQISAVENFGSKESKKFYSKIYNNYLSLISIIISILLLLIKPLARLLFAKDFYAAWECSCILLLATMFNGLAAFIGSVYTSSKRTGFLFHSTLIGAISNIILNLTLIPIMGAPGAAIATLASYFIVWLLRLINSKSIVRIYFNNKKTIITTIILIAQILTQLSNFSYSIAINIIFLSLLIYINKNLLRAFLAKVFIRHNKA